MFQSIGKRFVFGGEPLKDQRVYYFNVKEIVGNKYGTPSPVPFRVVDERAGIDIDIAIRCFGEYSYKVVNPLLLYANVRELRRRVQPIRNRQPAEKRAAHRFATRFREGVLDGHPLPELPGKTRELAAVLKEELSAQWRDYRGIEIEQVGVSSVKADEADEKMIKEMQRSAAFKDPTLAAAYMVGAQGAAAGGR